MDIHGPEPEDKARPRTNLHVARGAACDYGSEGRDWTSLYRGVGLGLSIRILLVVLIRRGWSIRRGEGLPGL